MTRRHFLLALTAAVLTLASHEAEAGKAKALAEKPGGDCSRAMRT